MKVLNLSRAGRTYTGNAYLVLGTWNAMADINTLVDVGRDESLLERLAEVNTGVGKRRVEQVVLTHSHYDHSSLLPRIDELYSPVVYAYSDNITGACKLRGGECLRLGDEDFDVLHVPAHSQDSVCLLGRTSKSLFCGDMPLRISASDASYDEIFTHALEHLVRAQVRVIYPGHGGPITENATAMLEEALRALRHP